MRSRTRFGQQNRPVNRRLGIIPGRRFAVVVVAAWLGSTGASATASNTPPSAQATIYQAGGTVPDTILNLLNCSHSYSGPYSIDEYGSNGTPLQPQAVPQTNVWSIADVIRCFTSPTIPLAAVQQVTIIASDGSPERLPNSQLVGPANSQLAGQDDLVAPSNFADPQEVPLVFDSGLLTYVRPWRGGNDDNAMDTTNPSNSQLQLDVFEGAVIPNVMISASPSTVQAGGTVSFTATVPGNHPNLTYSWDFDGGANDSTASSPSVPFDTPGVYQVTLQVIDTTKGSPGAAPPVTVTVTGDTSQTHTTTNSQTTPTGPAGSNGAAPRQGPGASPSKNPGRSGHHPGRSSARSGRHPTTRAATRPSPVPASGSGTGLDSGAGSGSASSGIFSGTPVHGPRPGSAGNAHGVRVDGRLISDVRLVAASASPLVHALPRGGAAPVLRRPSGPSPLPALAAALGVVVLFALGAGREIRWRARSGPLRSAI